MSPALLSDLLFLRNHYDMEGFDEMRIEAICALCIKAHQKTLV